MKGPLNDILETFQKNAKSVHELLTFDEVLLNIPIQELEALQSRLKGAGIENPRLGVNNTLQQLKNLRTNGSLKQHYRDLYNHGLVLLVSYFSSAVGDFFRRALIMALEDGRFEDLNTAEVKLPLGALRSREELFEDLGDFLIKQENISFQDMQSISRSCEKFLSVCPLRDSVVNDIIVAQACRHCLVHSGGIVDKNYSIRYATAIRGVFYWI